MNSELKPALAKAIIAVMKEIKGIEKDMQVGSGSYGYKGVADYEVKKLIKAAMEKNGLCILPTSVNAKTQVDRWEVNGAPKQSIFTEVETRYLLLHESGESVEISGYGHGVDSQDKGAGKATTYALKYALLYMFLVPTGKIDDADNTHSEEMTTPQKNQHTPDQIKKMVSAANTIDELNELYKKVVVVKSQAITDMFTERKNAIQ